MRPCQPCQWGQQLGKLGTSRTAVDHTSEDYHCDYCDDRDYCDERDFYDDHDYRNDSDVTLT